MEETLNIAIENEEILQVQEGTVLTLANCTCPLTTAPANSNAATTCRVIDIPVRFSNLCPNREFVFLVTVFFGTQAIGQTCATTVSNAASCNIDFTQNVRVLIKRSLCSTDNIRVEIIGNYVQACNI